MKKILAIFKNDLKTLYKNKIALIIIIGLIIIPGIYAWLNIDSNWSPLILILVFSKYTTDIKKKVEKKLESTDIIA